MEDTYLLILKFTIPSKIQIDGDDVVNLPTPSLPCFSNTDLSVRALNFEFFKLFFDSVVFQVLTREDPIFGDQYFNGSVFRNDQDYLVFRTRTVSLQNLVRQIFYYLENSQNHKSSRHFEQNSIMEKSDVHFPMFFLQVCLELTEPQFPRSLV